MCCQLPMPKGHQKKPSLEFCSLRHLEDFTYSTSPSLHQGHTHCFSIPSQSPCNVSSQVLFHPRTDKTLHQAFPQSTQRTQGPTVFFMPNLSTVPRIGRVLRLSPVLFRIGGRLWESHMICGQHIEVNSNKISKFFRVLWPVSTAHVPAWSFGCFVNVCAYLCACVCV